MVETAVIVVRLLQYLGAAILFGSSLFFVYAPGFEAPPRWARPLAACGAALLAAASMLAVAAQASLFAGSFAEGLTVAAMRDVVAYMDIGKAAVVRAALAALALVVLLFLPAGRSIWLLAAALGGFAAASLAWLGHAAVGEGALGSVHLACDILHVLAASVWVGALVCFVLLLLQREPVPEDALHGALVRFSALGPAIVAVLVMTGLVNAWVLVGPAHTLDLWATSYGRLLAVKLALFVVMLALAAVNRFRLTAALRTNFVPMIGVLKLNIAIETAAGFAILLLVAWLGTLAQPAAA